MTTIKIVESFLYKQTLEKKVSTIDYLTSLILNKMDFLEIKKDMKTLKSEIKPKHAHLLLNKL